MTPAYRGVVLAGGVVLSLAVYSSCRSTSEKPSPATPARPGTSPGSTPGPSALPPLPEPNLRVGILLGAAQVSIGSTAGVEVSTAGPGPGQRLHVARATLVPLATGQQPEPRFRVQVASVAEEAAARQVGELAVGVVGAPLQVRPHPAGRGWQVRVGAYAARQDAQLAAARLRAAGLAGAWVAADEAPAGGRLRLLETGQEFEALTLAPSDPAALLQVDATEYRGLIEVRVATEGLTVVNHVGLEDYLRGVVPNELSPAAFPQIEALKAQAVAARSYALRNRGQFQAQGYDLCATASCQVYKGRSSEHPLSDRAVAETEGLVALYGGRPIQAYYTSTCGGHTEDAANIFDTAEPYLRGVACLPEKSAWMLLRSTAAPGASRDAALLSALEVLEERGVGAASEALPREGELRRWVERLAAVSQRRGCDAGGPAPGGLTRRASFWRYLVASLCWNERAARLLGPEDAGYLLHVEDRDSLTLPAERQAAALLVSLGLLAPDADNRLRPDELLARLEAEQLLAGAALELGPPALWRASLRSISAAALEIERDGRTQSVPLDAGVRLFRDLDGSRSGASELSLVAGDALELVLRDGQVVYIEAEQSRLGPAADRSSRYFRWEVRTTPAELGRRAGLAGPVLDVQPRRFGVSGRVVELALVGAEGESLLRGLRIRNALGLRENLFVVDRELDPRGGIRRFVFTGKGWGHGVGLCQVGAFGLAQTGADFQAILRHYYSGVRVARLD